MAFSYPFWRCLLSALPAWPLYARLVRACGGRTPLAASIALAIVLLVLVIPLAVLLSYGVNEISTWVAWLVDANRQGIPVPQSVMATPFLGPWLAENWQRYLGEPRALGEIVQFLSGEHIGNKVQHRQCTARFA